MGTQGVVESYAKIYSGFRQIAQENRTATRTRLVWFVGIAGYVLVNGKGLWDAIGARDFLGVSLFWLSLPWALVALAAVITHYFVDELSETDDLYYVKKLAAIDLHLEAIKAGNADPNEMIGIFNDTDADLIPAKQANDKNAARVSRWERITFTLLVLGFIWSVAGPFILK